MLINQTLKHSKLAFLFLVYDAVIKIKEKVLSEWSSITELHNLVSELSIK